MAKFLMDLVKVIHRLWVLFNTESLTSFNRTVDELPTETNTSATLIECHINDKYRLLVGSI